MQAVGQAATLQNVPLHVLHFHVVLQLGDSANLESFQPAETCYGGFEARGAPKRLCQRSPIPRHRKCLLDAMILTNALPLDLVCAVLAALVTAAAGPAVDPTAMPNTNATVYSSATCSTVPKTAQMVPDMTDFLAGLQVPISSTSPALYHYIVPLQIVPLCILSRTCSLDARSHEHIIC